jgi:hypothetical protein
LGTILEISEQKITVALDGQDGKTVSFSPALYPYLDNGWATTIHKAQGVTVDHVKMLASFEQYRNLSYVGMTRHRHTLQVFGSDLDFWRDDKVVDRLSRVQEKLSGFDYLDADKIEQVLAEDTAVLWHDRKIGQAKDLWSAVKVTAQGLFNQLTGSPQQQEKGIGAEGFPSFDHSEEKRSTAFFQDGSRNLSGEDPASLKENNGSGQEKEIVGESKEDVPQADLPSMPGKSRSQDFQKAELLSAALDGEPECKAEKVSNQIQQGPSPTVAIKEKFLSFAQVEDQLRDGFVRQRGGNLLRHPSLFFNVGPLK